MSARVATRMTGAHAACGLLIVLGVVGCDTQDPVDAGVDASAPPDAALPADAGSSDATVDDAGADAGPPPPTGPVLYPADQRHSPIPADLAGALREVAASDATREDNRFIKVGDSITVSTAFLHCFGGTNVDLDGRSELEPTLERFRGGMVGGTTPFDRTSLSATVGWSASAALAGDPSPLDREHAAVNPRFAVVMFGSNDVGFRTPQSFARDVWTIVDRMLARGTLPLLSTIPPRDDSGAVDANVPLFNLAVRAIAQGRGVPLVDYHRELLSLPAHGLAGDGVHPRAFSGGSCQLTAEGLQFGSNVRNLITLEQLHRAVEVLEGGTLDVDAPRLAGTGTTADPYVAAVLPFAHMGDTSDAAASTIDTYACATANEAGPELVYRVEVTTPGRLTAAVLSPAGVDIDVHILRGSPTPDACVARDDTVVRADVEAGTWFVVADTFVGGDGSPLPGEFLVAIDLEP